MSSCVQHEPQLWLCRCLCSPAAGRGDAASPGGAASLKSPAEPLVGHGMMDSFSPELPSLFIAHLHAEWDKSSISWAVGLSCATRGFPGSFPHTLTGLLLPHPLGAGPWGWSLCPAGHYRAKDCALRWEFSSEASCLSVPEFPKALQQWDLGTVSGCSLPAPLGLKLLFQLPPCSGLLVLLAELLLPKKL